MKLALHSSDGVIVRQGEPDAIYTQHSCVGQACDPLTHRVGIGNVGASQESPVRPGNVERDP